MKIKLLFLVLIASITFANAQNEDTSSGWDEGVAAIIEMTPFDLKDIPSIYVGNLPAIWKDQGGENLKAYTNDRKNIWVVVEAEIFSDSPYQFKLSKGLKNELKKKKKSKAFIHKGVTRVVNRKGEVIKKIKNNFVE